jgi:Domain of unknown function (DUF1844)
LSWTTTRVRDVVDERASENKGFKVVDRRGSTSAETPSAPAATPSKPGTAPADVPAKDQVLGPIDFSTFLVSLASSALIHLGETPHPDSGEREVSLPHAQQTIDLIALLEVKTSGNLTTEETKLLHALLRDLRMRFVSASSK